VCNYLCGDHLNRFDISIDLALCVHVYRCRTWIYFSPMSSLCPFSLSWPTNIFSAFQLDLLLRRVSTTLHTDRVGNLLYSFFCMLIQALLGTLLPGWYSCHQSMTPSLRFSIDGVGWRLQNESTKNLLFWHSNFFMGQCHRSSLTRSSGPQFLRLELIFAQRNHHKLIVVNDRQLPATELFQSPFSPPCQVLVRRAPIGT